MTSKLRVAPVGTCRIHTPLRSGSGRHQIVTELGRNYGFVQTTAEALQQLRFMLEGTLVPSDISRVVYRPTVPEGFLQSTHTRADVYLIEISSRKLVTVEGRPVQINYLQRYFNDFFMDRERSRWFWHLATPEQQKERADLLRKERAFQRLNAADKKLLAAVVRRDQIDDEVEREILEIADYVGRDRVIFNTHVDALTPDNTLLDHRHRMIQLVRNICRKADLPCYDPTPLMREVGQMNAMENLGLDLTHYTDAFSARLCDDWNRRLFAPRLNTLDEGAVTAPEGDDVDSVGQLEAMWNNGQLIEVSRRLRNALRENPALHEHRALLGQIQFEFGDYEGAVQSLERLHTEVGASEGADMTLMRAHFQLGQFDAARRLAVGLLSDECASPEILRISAVSATALGEHEAALHDWKQLFQRADDKSEAASAVLDALVRQGDVEGANAWAGEVLTVLPGHEASFDYLWSKHVADGNRAALSLLAEKPVTLAADRVCALADLAIAADIAAPAAKLAAERGLMRNSDPVVADWLNHHATLWLTEGEALLEQGELARAADKIQARWHVRPMSKQLVRLRRALEQLMRRNVRQLFAAGDHAGVVAMIDAAQAAQFEFPEMDSYYGRSADALGDAERALFYMKRAADEDGSPVSWLVQFGRTAARHEQYVDAIHAYRQVLVRGGVEEMAIDKARRQLESLALKAARVARVRVSKGDLEGAWALVNAVLEVDAGHVQANKERSRILATYRARLKALGAGNDLDRRAIGKAILEIAPEDQAGLRAAAVGAMRLHDFAAAQTYWQRLRGLVEDPSKIDVNIQKCQLWLDRARRREADLARKASRVASMMSAAG